MSIRKPAFGFLTATTLICIVICSSKRPRADEPHRAESVAKPLNTSKPSDPQKASDSPKTRDPQKPSASPKPFDPLAWPSTVDDARPWTRWWWLGSEVEKDEITRLLEQYREAGIGGVEICPIYGAKGQESKYIDFLSPKWIETLAHTTTEAKRLGLGVDMTTGTGWPFGGPSVAPADASSRIVMRAYDIRGGSRLNDKLPDGTIVAIRAVSPDGSQIDLISKLKDGRFDWVADPGVRRLYVIAKSGPVQKVKRAAPGGEGWVVDPFSTKALEHYLAAFDRALEGFKAPPPRAWFHDSFEYYGADWTDDFFNEFERRRGYDLLGKLPAFFGEGSEEIAARVKYDYRMTISDLHLEFIKKWADWSHKRGGSARDQAHGAPANLLDVYAAVDIPETEIFRAPSDSRIPLVKFASSAANATGRPLASSESFTWLGEHFEVSLAQVKPAADYLFLCGINHIFFHGIPYSPADASWPGRLFYASVNFGPNGGLWRDLPALNAYISRCQSILRSGRPSNDVLLYFPIHDYWQSSRGSLIPLPIAGAWLTGTPFQNVATTLWNRGYPFDVVSDRLLDLAEVKNNHIILGGNSYRVVVVPNSRFMPDSTLIKLAELARGGAKIVFDGATPTDVPGLGDLDARRERLRRTLGDLGVKVSASPTIFASKPAQGPRVVTIGKGSIVIAPKVEEGLEKTDSPRETMTDSGLRFVRRVHDHGYEYFLVNRSDHEIAAWIPLAVAAGSAVLLDPMIENRSGAAALRRTAEGATQVYLQMAPGESLVLRAFRDRAIESAPWKYQKIVGDPIAIEGTWKVTFIDGGPVLPKEFETKSLGSWTDSADPEAKRFAGTAVYRIEFDRPERTADAWRLDLGRVCESARVRLNGRSLGTLFAAPFHVDFANDALTPGKNVLEIEATNLAANRIVDLDRRGVDWKSFHEINFVNLDYKPFDASKKPIRPSGLLGPVRLIPLVNLNP
jgi:hypothetical protein